MAALTLALGLPARDASEAVAGNARLVNVPAGARSVIIQPMAAPCRLLVQADSQPAGPADTAALGTAYLTLAANTPLAIPVPNWAWVAGWRLWTAPDSAASITIEYLASSVAP
jgi:hypothetical protein